MQMNIDSANMADGVVVIKSRSQVSDAELKAVLEINSKWPYHGHRDGWYRAHEAIRADMRDISEGLKACVAQLQSGKRLANWQTNHLKVYWPKFLAIVHHHHDNEELIAFPFVSTRVQLPPKMSADHVTLLKLMDEVTAMIARLATGRTSSVDFVAWSALSDKFDAFRREMQEHLREEDEIGLPMLRKYFSYQEYKPIEKKIVAGMSLEDMAWFLRPFGNDFEKRKWMTEVAKIPGLVQSLVILPACRKWHSKYAHLLDELKAGHQIPKEPSSCFGR